MRPRSSRSRFLTRRTLSLGYLVPIISFTTKAGSKRTFSDCPTWGPSTNFWTLPWIPPVLHRVHLSWARVFMFAYSWDEWVPSNRLLKFNETNLATQKSLQQSNAPAASTAAAAKAASRAANKDGGGVGTRGARKDGTRGTKRGREEVCAAELFFFYPFGTNVFSCRMRARKNRILNSTFQKSSKDNLLTIGSQ